MPISTIGSNSLNQTSDLTINGVTVGKGGGSVTQNTVVGASAGSANTTGKITAVGYLAARFNTTGSGNTAIGGNDGAQDGALYYNTTGNYNIAMGTGAVASNTTGSNNTGLGYQALNGNTTASGNTAVGYQAGYSISTNTGTTFVGWTAGKNATGNYNTIIGYNAVGGAGGAGTDNTIIGYSAGVNLTSGSGNTLLGDNAGAFLTTPSANTFIGGGIVGSTGGAGFYVTTGAKNTILGCYNGNQDSLDIRTANNYVVLSDGDGNRAAFWQSGGGWVQKNNSTSWSTFSDQRIKENIVSIEQGLDVISALRPVKFDYIQTGKHEVGFIAQEYETVLPEQIDKQYGIDDATKELVNDDHILSIQQNLVPYLVKAIQELKAINDQQAETINALTARIEALENK